MAAYAVGFEPGMYRVRIWQGIRFYVGYSTDTEAAQCVRYMGTQTSRMPLASATTTITILAGAYAACPGFDIDADGTLWVDVPTDDAGNARRFISEDAGSTWTEIV